ncbi:MAG TPA: hypothetical protein VGR35_21700 [Tepidisphaeraceae bacterium]|nr:hypothetical protein [Tepidisphaeraceae bacterium]
MTSKRALVLVAAVTLSLAACSVAMAQQSRPYGEEGHQRPQLYQAPELTSVNNPYSDYPAAEVQAVPAAKARAAIAKMELLRAQANLNRGTRAAVRTFEHSDEVSKARSEQNQAYQQYQAARERALQPLQNDEQYRAAQIMKQELRDQIVERHYEAGPEKPVLHEIIAMAGLKLRYATQMTNREVEALRSSPEVSEARERLVAASERVTNLRQRFDQDLRDDPDLIAARRAVFDQKVAHVASQAYLAGLKEARGIALDYAYFVRRYNPYRVMGYDRYGFHRSYYGYGGAFDKGYGY